MVGIALVIQGCWQQEEDRLVHLGEDGCRTADGSEGEYTVVSARSSEECEAQCRDTTGGVRLSNTTTTIGSAKSTISRLLSMSK
jgi:hypothetical protein